MVKKILSAVTALSLMSAFIITPDFSIKNTDSLHNILAIDYESAHGINVNYRTMDEIKEYVTNHPFDVKKQSSYTISPQNTYPYVPGSLNQETLDNALNSLNVVRFIAGLDEVSLKDEYNSYAQATSLVNSVNNTLTHYPEQPNDMPDDLYGLGAYGARHSNIGMGYINIAKDVVYGFMYDSSSNNISTVGHRRWCLNPSMQFVGFGMVDRFTAMYAHDKSKYSDEYGVCYPAQNMPIEYFASNVPWSISMGYTVDISKVKVILTRESDSKTWIFSEKSSDGNFYVNNEWYGQIGCIIFRPSDIDRYSNGDTFNVKIEGLKEDVSYSVNFFSVETHGLGDVDRDGKVDSADATLVLTEYALIQTGQESALTAEQLKSADTDRDGKIDSADATKILVYYADISTGKTPSWD